ncbi:MAG TPA: tyrosine-type recombinase/integrase [Actinomycetota bacterium]|nr:tyrosine-type recombinase/integrase [Actinomycetota bacterium]
MVLEEFLAELSGRLISGPTKTHATRRIPLTASLTATLEKHLECIPSDPDAFLFTSPEGSPPRLGRFEGVWHPSLAALGLPAVGIHVLRHSAAAGLIHSGASPKAVHSILGHRSVAFTLTV